MKPKFSEVIRLGVRKDLAPIINDADSTIISTMHNVLIKAVNGIDDDIVNKIKIIAMHKGIDTVYLLDKKNILSALEKQIPKKPTPHKVEVDKIKIGNANWCKGTTVFRCPCCNDFISRVYDYCPKCGQALEWGDGE